MKLDVIVPAYNEEDNILLIHKELSNVLKNIKYNIIFVDDGSTDNTFEKLNTAYDKDSKHVKVISFSRNFGKDAAIYAGLKASRAEYACIIDSDMQQNPKYLLEMLDFLEKNKDYDEIAMVNTYENNKLIARGLKKSFYRLINKLSDQKFTIGASDFRMFRKYVVATLVNMSEKNRFTKGLFSWVGFNIYYMPYKVEKRASGTSKFKLKKQITYATDGIISFSTKPLKIATILGILFSTVSFIYFIQILFQTVIYGKDIPGYASIMCVTLLIGGIQLLVLGIIGEYIAKSYIEIKNRPIYVEKKSLGFDDNIL